MKKATLFTLLMLAGFGFTQAQKVGDKVQIDWKGSWYEGKIVQVNEEEGTYLVSYDGWGEESNEWVGKDRLKGLVADAPPAQEKPAPLTKFKVGDRVMAEYGMLPTPAKVIYVGENSYEVEFDNSLYGKKVLKENQLKKM